MKQHIVIINGTGGCGKDTFVELVSKYNRVLNVSSVDKVKEIATLAGWTGGKEEVDRKFLSVLKRLTTEYNDMSFRDIEEKVSKFRNSDLEVMFIHIREPEEIERAKNAFGAETLLIRRVGLSSITSNYSDANVENYTYDYIIENSTLENLEKKAMNFVSNLNSKPNILKRKI